MNKRICLLGALCILCLSSARAQDATPAQGAESGTAASTQSTQKTKGGRVAKMGTTLNMSDEQKGAVRTALQARKLIKTAQKSGALSKDDAKTALQANKEMVNATLNAEQQARLDSTRKAVKDKRKAAKSNK